MAEALLRLEGVVKEYGGGVATRVLHGIVLRIEAGEFTAMIGPSGSGKTTLLNLLGLLDRPSSGTIWLQGRKVNELDEDELTRLRGQTLGFVFQFHHLLSAFSVLENVMMPALALQGYPDAAMRARALELLKLVSLEDRAAYPATNISGGQQQRAALARALMCRPALVLADEPTGNLDTRTGEQVFELLRRINLEQGTAFLIVTHNAEIAQRCDRILEIVDGRIRSDHRSARGLSGA